MIETLSIGENMAANLVKTPTNADISKWSFYIIILSKNIQLYNSEVHIKFQNFLRRHLLLKIASNIFGEESDQFKFILLSVFEVLIFSSLYFIIPAVFQPNFLFPRCMCLGNHIPISIYPPLEYFWRNFGYLGNKYIPFLEHSKSQNNILFFFFSIHSLDVAYLFNNSMTIRGKEVYMDIEWKSTEYGFWRFFFVENYESLDYKTRIMYLQELVS